MIELHNWDGSSKPNIFHFQGQSRHHYAPLFQEMSEQKILNDSRLHILTVATDESQSPLIKQLRTSSISYVNIWNNAFYCNWSNTKKIELIIQQLKKMDPKDVVLMLDGYDTAIQSLDGLYDKFLSTGYDIVFNSTKHNWPNVRIDRYWERDFVGDFCYFNAGVVIGFVYALLDFYEECLSYTTIENPWDSEQYIIRHAWANYSEQEDRHIDFDHSCKMFQTMGSTRLEKIEEKQYKVI